MDGARSGVPGHGQCQGLQRFVVIPAGLLQDLGQLVQQLLEQSSLRLKADVNCANVRKTDSLFHD
jgi:hypothetical protein